MSSSKTGRRDSRRNFIALAGVTGAAVLAGMRPALSLAQGQGVSPPHLSESDPTAKALGYVEDASKADKAKFPAYKAGAHCATCNFFQGKPADAYAPCQIFPGKAVSAKGWCASYSQKG